MSALAEPLNSPRLGTAVMARVSADSWLTVGVASVVAATAFAADGGLRLEPTTWTEVGLLLLGGGLVATAAIRRGFSGRVHGALPLLWLGVLAAFSALSIVWSLSPADSWTEANRTFAYVAAMAGAIALVRLAPGHWPAILKGISLGCVVVCGWALLTKVFPGAIAADETYARLRAPFGYWNAVGLMAALGVPPLLWLASRRAGHPAANALAWPGLGILFTALMLSYSRGALLAVIVGIAVWFAIVPLRVRAALPLIASALIVAPVVTWAFARDALSQEQMPLIARVDAGHDLGALLLLVVALLLGVGLAANFLADQRPISEATRGRIGRGLVALVVCIPLVTLGLLLAAPGGIKGQTSQAWDQVTNPVASTPSNTPNRLTATSSVRARYWREGLRIYADEKLLGAGAGAYVVARTRFRGDKIAVRHAHGYVVQTLADLGLIGLALSLVATVGWGVAALAATGLRRRDRGRPFDPERIGLITMAVVVVTFGVHSAIDWTWFVPANALVALVCAGWVVGRGPLRERDGEAPAPTRASRVRVAAAVGVAVLALAASWAALQPVRAAQAEDRAVSALERGDEASAERDARAAERYNPLSLDPLWLLAAVADARGDRAAASRALERAAREQPANSEAWRRLGRYRLSVLDDPKGAVEAFRVAYYFDPDALRSASDLLEATRAAAAK